MPRPMLKTQAKQQTEHLLQTDSKQEMAQQNRQTDKLQVDRILRQRRSARYMQALTQLDAGGHVQNQEKVDELLAAVCSEFPEIEIEKILLGFVSRCYLGKPYEVHTLDRIGGIIEHYKAGAPLPDGLEKARGIAMYGGYAFIEVYVDCCRAVSPDGIVSVISG